MFRAARRITSTTFVAKKMFDSPAAAFHSRSGGKITPKKLPKIEDTLPEITKESVNPNYDMLMRTGWNNLIAKNYQPKEAEKFFKRAIAETGQSVNLALAYNGLSAARLASAALAGTSEYFNHHKAEALRAAEKAMEYAPGNRQLRESYLALKEIYFDISFGKTIPFNVKEGMPVSITEVLKKTARKKEHQNWHNATFVANLGRMQGQPMESTQWQREHKSEIGIRRRT